MKELTGYICKSKVDKLFEGTGLATMPVKATITLCDRDYLLTRGELEERCKKEGCVKVSVKVVEENKPIEKPKPGVPLVKGGGPGK